MLSTQPSHIKSFVKRMGRLSKGQKHAIETLFPTYGLENKNTFLDFEQIFQRKAPTCLEIGFGMGDSLVEMAIDSPDKNFIGIDIYKPGVGTLLANVKDKELTNIRIFSDDAIDILKQCIPDNSLEAIYLLFPDPWPKRKHHKRRIVQPEFLTLIAKKLMGKGVFYLATDWEDYANQMMEVLSLNNCFKNVFGCFKFAPNTAYRSSTKFEKRGEKLGHDTWDLVFIKAL